MTTNTPPSPPNDEADLSQRLETMAQLLELAAMSVWARLETDGPRASLNSLGLGIHLACCRARRILIANHSASLITPEVDDPMGHSQLQLPAADVDDRTAVQLLTTADELSRPLSLWQGDLSAVTQLAVDLGELVREAKHLGC